jgi:hypothetical protein
MDTRRPKIMKRTSMAQALNAAAGHAHSRQLDGISISAQAEPVKLPRTRTLRAVAPSREGKKPVTGFFSPETSRQLKKLALDQDKTLQELVGEALNDLFHKYDLPPIA